MFPQVYADAPNSPRYMGLNAAAHIGMDRQTGWGLQGTPTRAGLALPLSASTGDRRSSFEVFLQNQIRIDIQRHLESGALQLD